MIDDQIGEPEGCFGCGVMLILLFVFIGFVGLAWKFMLWCWS